MRGINNSTRYKVITKKGDLIINEIPCINQTVLSTMIDVVAVIFNSYFIDDKFLDEIYEELQMFNAIVNDGRSV